MFITQRWSIWPDRVWPTPLLRVQSSGGDLINRGGHISNIHPYLEPGLERGQVIVTPHRMDY